MLEKIVIKKNLGLLKFLVFPNMAFEFNKEK